MTIDLFVPDIPDRCLAAFLQMTWRERSLLLAFEPHISHVLATCVAYPTGKYPEWTRQAHCGETGHPSRLLPDPRRLAYVLNIDKASF